MGLARATMSWLMEESLRRPFKGTLLTLGVQNIFLTVDEFEALAAKMGCSLSEPIGEPLAGSERVTSDYAFGRLGFGKVVTTDVNDFEGCDFVFDLNAPTVPDAHRGAYDVIIDGGTLEHVFHVPNALRNLLRFAASDGRIVHISPSSNHIDHGFWMFSPTLFKDYYTVNAVELPRFDIFRYRKPTDHEALWDFGTYDPDAIGRKSFGGLGGGCFGLAIVAEKAGDVDEPLIPQQGMYVEAWQGARSAPQAVGKAGIAQSIRRKRVRLREMILRLVPPELRIRAETARRGFPVQIRRRF